MQQLLDMGKRTVVQVGHGRLRQLPVKYFDKVKNDIFAHGTASPAMIVMADSLSQARLRLNCDVDRRWQSSGAGEGG